METAHTLPTASEQFQQTVQSKIQNPKSKIALILLLFVLIGYIVYPAVRVVWESFFRDGQATLRNYREFFDLGHRANLEALMNSLALSAGSVLLSALIGVPLALIFSSYEFPGRAVFASLATVPIVLPPLVGVIAFMFLYSESGIVPRLLQTLFGLDDVPFSLRGVWAILVVHAYTMYVFFYLFTAAALKGIDPSVEEAAVNLGASRWFRFRTVVLPLLTPALVAAALLVFMTSMASFSAPFIFAGGFRVLSLSIYTSKLNGDMAMAITQTVVLSACSLSVLVGLRRYEGRRRYAMSGKGVAARRRAVRGRWTRFLFGGIGIMATIVLLLPHLTILLISFVKDGTWTWQLLPTTYTAENYRRLFDDPRVFEPITNSLTMATLATAGDVGIGLAAAYLVVKGRIRGRRTLDALVMIPWALPGTVVALNLIVSFSQATPFSLGQVLVGTVWLLPIAYGIRHLPIVFRSTAAALEQVDDSVEEAARSLGATWGYAFRRVTLPLIRPGVLAGTLLAFVTALGEFVSSILLYVYKNRPISVEILSQLRQFNFGSAAAYGVLLLVLVSAVLLASSVTAEETAERSPS
ncbi:MAG: iron ABC transporter permease [Candidatus Latescibacteria bacterium]|nr:iron ABC transporter permease [Candidatus Latescibacterota bacterium]